MKSDNFQQLLGFNGCKWQLLQWMKQLHLVNVNSRKLKGHVIHVRNRVWNPGCNNILTRLDPFEGCDL